MTEIAEVTTDDGDLLHDVIDEFGGRIDIKNGDVLFLLLYQEPRHVGADKTGPSGDQYGHVPCPPVSGERSRVVDGRCHRHVAQCRMRFIGGWAAHLDRYQRSPGRTAARAADRNASNPAGSARASMETTDETSAPARIRLIGTSHFLPLRVRGTAETGTTAPGTCRGDSSDRINERSRGSTSVSSAASASTTNNSRSPSPEDVEVSTTSESVTSGTNSTAR